MLTHRITAWGFVAGMTVLGASLALAQEGANAAPKEQTEQRDVLGGPRVKSEQPARPAERRESMGEPLREVLPQLDLTPEQREKIKAIMDQARTEREKFRDENHEQLEKLHKELRAAGEAKDEQKAREILKQIRAIQEKGPRPMDQLNKIKEVLTPEQREKLELKLRELEKKMREQREQMGPGPGPGGPAERREGIGEPLREVLPQLDLTPEQREKIKTIMDQARTEREKFRDENHEQLEKLHKDLRAAGEARDEQKAREILKQIRAIQEKGPRPMDQLNKIKEVLTPEQREKLELKLRELEKKMREQREQMGPGPGPGGPRPEREGGPDARPNPAP